MKATSKSAAVLSQRPARSRSSHCRTPNDQPSNPVKCKDVHEQGLIQSGRHFKNFRHLGPLGLPYIPKVEKKKCIYIYVYIYCNLYNLSILRYHFWPESGEHVRKRSKKLGGLSVGHRLPSHTGLALSWFASISGSLSPIRRWKRVSNSMSDKGLTPKCSDITDVQTCSVSSHSQIKSSECMYTKIY